MGGFIVTVLIAVLVGWLGNAISPGRMPGDGWIASLVALIGAWIGAYMPYFNVFGPRVMEIALVPAFLGALIATMVFGAVSRIVKQTS
ncbi:MAG: transglycosylase [Clostridium sp.]|nr:transglycosylase [Clostridium sp.]